VYPLIEKLAREPLVHFLLIGAAIYALFGFLEGDGYNEDERTVTVSSNDIQSLTGQWAKTRNRPPTEDELAGMIADHARTQILYREAVAMGLDDGDLVIQRRLAQKVEFLARGLVTPADPPDETLIAWYAANAERFKQPDRYSITQIYFDPSKRQQATLEDANEVLEGLKELAKPPLDYSGYGDRIMLKNHYQNNSEQQLENLFGSAFVDSVVTLQPETWSGPIISGYGAHLVMVDAVMIAPQPAFADIKEKISEQWMAEQIAERSERFIENLLSRYDIVVEDTGVEDTEVAQ
jgi:peptidyl-prolyl cis-trans isomerase C